MVALILIGWSARSFSFLFSKGSFLNHLMQVTTPLLKFMAEFVLNKAQRLTFDSSSPNGILLFREVSKLIVAYGSRILSLPNAADIYAFKYKGIWISLTILSRGKIMDLLINCFAVLFTVMLKSNQAWFLIR